MHNRTCGQSAWGWASLYLRRFRYQAACICNPRPTSIFNASRMMYVAPPSNKILVHLCQNPCGSNVTYNGIKTLSTCELKHPRYFCVSNSQSLETVTNKTLAMPIEPDLSTSEIQSTWPSSVHSVSVIMKCYPVKSHHVLPRQFQHYS